ncbi:hypothetical protein G6F63_015092 [Rhizopus arrhizus]|nr:hypothetical protein G6F63_015092 [Rhizopus arrhizus]
MFLVIAELSALRTENASLKSKIATLEAQLASSSSPSVSSAASVSLSAAKPTALAAQNVSSAVPATYSAVAARPAARSPNKKRKLAASRAFQPIDPDAPREIFACLVWTCLVSSMSVSLAPRLLVFWSMSSMCQR